MRDFAYVFFSVLLLFAIVILTAQDKQNPSDTNNSDSTANFSSEIAKSADSAKHYHIFWDSVTKRPVIEETLLDDSKVIIRHKKPADQEDAPDFQIIPNPATNFITIKGVTNIHSLKIYNSDGFCVLDTSFKNPQKDNLEMNISDMPQGTYIIVIDGKRATFVKK